MSVVLFDHLTTANGFTIGVVTLNQPQVLNGFSYEMATLLQQQMNRWEQDSSVIADSFSNPLILIFSFRHIPLILTL